jgi:hypothetical protein
MLRWATPWTGTEYDGDFFGGGGGGFGLGDGTAFCFVTCFVGDLAGFVTAGFGTTALA